MRDRAATGDEGEGGESSGGLFSSGRRLAGDLAATVANRAELLVLEAQEERDHLIRLAVLAIAALVLFILALTAMTAVAVVLAGEEHRVAALLAAAALYAAAGLWSARRMVLAMRTWESFPATLAELKKDRDWLRTPPPN